MLTNLNIGQKLSRISSATLSLILGFGIILTVAPSAHAVTLTAQPMISFTFDDGMANARTLAAEALKASGYTGTSYVVPTCVGMITTPNTCNATPDVTYMTWAQIKELHDLYGWEIGSHTLTHPLLTSTDPDSQPVQLTPAQVTTELAQSKADITANTGVTPTAFASPYGDYDPTGQAILSQVAKYYTSHRGFADTGYNTFPYNDYLLRDQMVQLDNQVSADNVTVATAKSYIDTAVANNQWLILTFHEIVASGAGATGEYQYNVADLAAIAAYAKTKGIKNANISDGLAGNPNGGNLLTNYTFDAPIGTYTNTAADTTNWTTDAAANIGQDGTNNGSSPSSTSSTLISSTTSGTLHLFSPTVDVSAKPYVIKAYLNMQTIGVLGELAFFVDEYDANGAYITTQYKKAWSVFNAPNPLVTQHSFEYTPTTTLNSAPVTVAKARLQLVAVTDTGMKCFIDNIQWFAEDGSTGAPAVVSKPGDVNNDNFIDALDLSNVLANWNLTGATKAQGDLNNDGAVDALDLSTVLTNWGK